jgi:hypothetical protein
MPTDVRAAESATAAESVYSAAKQEGVLSGTPSCAGISASLCADMPRDYLAQNWNVPGYEESTTHQKSATSLQLPSV